jgi:hypothetical protein
MKNKFLIITASILAVVICLVLTLLLFFAVPPNYIIVLAFTIGVITGVIITAIILSLKKIIQTK